MKLRAALVATLLVTAAVAAVKSGPAVGSDTPMLGIDPINGGDAFCAAHEAGRQPLVVLFVAKPDHDTKALLTELDRQYKAHHEHGWHAAAVIVSRGDDAAALAKFVKDRKLSVPAALVPLGDDGLEDWHLSPKAHHTVVLNNGGKVKESTADLAPRDLAGHIQHQSPCPHCG